MFEYHSKECPSQKHKQIISETYDCLSENQKQMIIAFAAMTSLAAAVIMRFSSQSHLSFLVVVVKYHQHFVFWQPGTLNLHLNYKFVLCSSACL